MTDEQDDPQVPSPLGLRKPGANRIDVDLGPRGVVSFPNDAKLKERIEKYLAADSTSFQTEGDGFSIGKTLKRIVTSPEAAGMAGFAVGGPWGAGLAAGGMSLAKDAVSSRPLDPITAGKDALIHGGINAIPGIAAGAMRRVPGAMAGSTNGVLSTLGKVMGGGGAEPAAAELRTGGSLLSNGDPLLADASKMKLGTKATDAANAVGLAKGGAKADMRGLQSRLDAAFDDLSKAIRMNNAGQHALVSDQTLAALKESGLNPQTIMDLMAKRTALAGHGIMTGLSTELEGDR